MIDNEVPLSTDAVIIHVARWLRDAGGVFRAAYPVLERFHITGVSTVREVKAFPTGEQTCEQSIDPSHVE